ncbi:MAG: FAD-binding protein, partial [Chloroflexota bacterium]|nr:FAD-binding protein [Chloroflexota bacterium]
GEVRGVLAQRGGKEIAVKATRAVILTCGGFEFNDMMKQNYLRIHPSYFYGTPACTGDGINMVLEVGAALWHMNCSSWRVVTKVPQFPISFSITPRLAVTGGLFVDRRGKRFANERFKQHAFGYELANYDGYLMGYPRVPCYWIFDEKRRLGGPLASGQGPSNPPGGVPGPNFYVWSENNEVEMEKGWVLSAPTIRGLAAKLAEESESQSLMRPWELEESVASYHRWCEVGEDQDFHRQPPTLVPLDKPPYYAVKLWPGGPNTQGGPKRNGLSQVLRPDNTPISRLYAAGELGSVWGMFYQGGGNLAECIVFGRIAGANAAQEKPWG